jgi:regulatory protein
VGLIDDEAFAHAWVRSRHTGRGLARRALAHELRRRGVDDEVVAGAVETLDTDDERAAARTLVVRRLATMSGLPRDVQARRLAGMLARKGYSGGLALAVVREVLDDPDALPDQD